MHWFAEACLQEESISNMHVLLVTGRGVEHGQKQSCPHTVHGLLEDGPETVHTVHEHFQDW